MGYEAEVKRDLQHRGRCWTTTLKRWERDARIVLAAAVTLGLVHGIWVKWGRMGYCMGVRCGTINHPVQAQHLSPNTARFRYCTLDAPKRSRTVTEMGVEYGGGSLGADKLNTWIRDWARSRRSA